MSYQDLTDPKPKQAVMLCNEAVARAVLESDAKVTAFYPGSPTSEILDTLYLLSADYPDLKMEISSNEAVARAVLESDAKVTAFYPGSPTSEILDTLYLLSADYPDLKMEISSNEKVALDTVAGASMAGVRSFTSMKRVGLNVARDTFYTLGYPGVNGGCVLLVADG